MGLNQRCGQTLEHETELGVLQQQYVGRLSEPTVNRFLKEREIFFLIRNFKKKAIKSIEVESWSAPTMAWFSGFVCTNPKDEAEIKKRIESVILSPRWNWAWTCEEVDHRLVASFLDEAYKRHQS